MNETPDPTPGDAAQPPGDTTYEQTTGSGPRVTRDQVQDLSRLRRPTDRKVAGVAAGLARHLDVDPLLLRVAFVVLAFFGGAGILLYGALWLLLPEDGKAEAPLHLDERSRGAAVIGVGVLAALALLGDSWGLYWFPWPLALIALVVWFLFFRDRTPQAPSDAPQYAAPQYAEQYGPDPYAPERYAPRPALTRPRDPRKRGPLLFGFTLALIVLAEGVLAMVDLADVPVADSAYPALALAIVGTMLVVGAFYGRAGGLILLGLLAAALTAGSLATEHWDDDDQVVVPRTSSQLESTYEFGAGSLQIDLRRVRDLDGLDGRDLDLSGGVGRLEVLVPAGLDVDVDASVGGPGRIILFDDVDRDGISTSASASQSHGTDQPRITIDAELGVGEIVVKEP